MTQEDRELLVKDLCSRLPYGVYVEHINTGMRGHLHDLKVYPLYDKTDDYIYDYICSTDFLGDGDYFDIEYFKPYLFPLSNMTEEQKEECFNGTPLEIDKYGGIAVKDDFYGGSLYTNLEIYLEVIDWLLKNHFDIYDLISKGLALDATGLNIY